MMDAGVRAAWAVSSRAVPLMIEEPLPNGQRLIVNISVWAAQKFIGNTIYGVSKAATDKLTADMAHKLRKHGISVVSLYPGLVRTEAVLAAASQGWFKLENSESPEFLGRVIAALAGDPRLRQRSGTIVVAAQAAMELGVTDVDGKQPAPLTLETA
jgi:dehydrogenase/reductase SDR family protein 1